MLAQLQEYLDDPALEGRFAECLDALDGRELELSASSSGSEEEPEPEPEPELVLKRHHPPSNSAMAMMSSDDI
jgi:hypothetical protein